MDTPLLSENYLFTSQRLGFRNWRSGDLEVVHAMCTDPEVMTYFPKLYTLDESRQFITKMQDLFSQYGYCFYAIERLDNGTFAGFTGFSHQTFKSEFTPCVDIGWRLVRSEWGQGLATEAAKRCLEYANSSLPFDKVYAMAPSINLPSIHVMQKIGMKWEGRFLHPELEKYPDLAQLDLYSTEI